MENQELKNTSLGFKTLREFQDGSEEYYLLEGGTMQTYRNLPMLWRNIITVLELGW